MAARRHYRDLTWLGRGPWMSKAGLEAQWIRARQCINFFFICNFRLVFVTEPHFSQNAVESCGMPQKSQPDGPGRDKKSFCLLSVFKRRSLGLRMKKISCRDKGIIPAKPCLITKLNSSGIWMSFQSWQLICPTLFLFNQIKRKVISYKAYSKELGKIYVISKPQINLVLR